MPYRTGRLKRAIGLRDIAEQVGVSVSLVSKVLSRNFGTSGATKELIRAIEDKARELNYRKNRLADALKRGQQDAIAICVHRIGCPGSNLVGAVMRSIATVSAAAGRRLVIHYYDTIEEFRAICPDLNRSTIDGLVLAGVPHPEMIDDLHAILRGGVPIVTVHDCQLDKNIPNVGVSQSEIGLIATRHLIEQGARAIAHFIPIAVGRTSPGTPDRYLGYRQAIDQAGIEHDPARVIEVRDYLYPAGLDGMNALLRGNIHFDALFVQSDHHSMAALNTLLRAGRRVPEDVKIVGVDDSTFCPIAAVELSSVSQELSLRGRHAAKLLGRLIDGDDSVQSIMVPPVLRARTSSLANPADQQAQRHSTTPASTHSYDSEF